MDLLNMPDMWTIIMERQESFVEDELAAGHNVILEIEVQGAFNIKKQYEDALLIFITAPSAAAIKERLVGRGTESEEVINKRLNRAKEESEDMDKYDYIVINESGRRLRGSNSCHCAGKRMPAWK